MKRTDWSLSDDSWDLIHIELSGSITKKRISEPTDWTFVRSAIEHKMRDYVWNLEWSDWTEDHNLKSRAETFRRVSEAALSLKRALNQSGKFQIPDCWLVEPTGINLIFGAKEDIRSKLAREEEQRDFFLLSLDQLAEKNKKVADRADWQYQHRCESRDVTQMHPNAEQYHTEILVSAVCDIWVNQLNGKIPNSTSSGPLARFLASIFSLAPINVDEGRCVTLIRSEHGRRSLLVQRLSKLD